MLGLAALHLHQGPMAPVVSEAGTSGFVLQCWRGGAQLTGPWGAFRKWPCRVAQKALGRSTQPHHFLPTSAQTRTAGVAAASNSASGPSTAASTEALRSEIKALEEEREKALSSGKY